MVDLWPEGITKVSMKSPVTILNEQASLLGQKTQNIVLAEVSKSEADSIYFPILKKGFSADFVYVFSIVSPVLNNYKFRLFRIGFGIGLYPAIIVPDSDIEKELSTKGISFTAKDEHELYTILKEIFNTAKTIKVVHSILSQVE